MSNRAVFLDRDGTIIEDLGYPSDPEKVELITGVGPALAALRREGWMLVLVSTQSGVGRGLIEPHSVRLVHDRMLELLQPYGVTFADSRYCLHAPWDGCACRKPSPLMLVRASRRLDIDMAASFMVGDKPEDVEAGTRAGCRAILFASTAGVPPLTVQPELVSENWSHIRRHIMASRSEGQAETSTE
jgi:D-glycero-D-manno-heptose 1,7-bisphosphate phosphatase